MKLKIDTNPKVGRLVFSTLQAEYSMSTSPRSIIKQSGLEFDHFRKYEQADDISQIDWVASARVDDLLVRVYSENTSLNILIMLDVSETMIYGTGDKAKIEFAVELAINTIFGILNYGDAVGIIVYNQDIVKAVPFRIGTPNFPELFDAITDSTNFGGGLDFEKALGYAMEAFKNTHLIIVISDFLGYKDKLYPPIHSIADSLDILGMMVLDKSDVALDSKMRFLTIKDPLSQETRIVQTKRIADIYEKANYKRIQDMKNFFMAIHKDLWIFMTDDNIEKKLPTLAMTRAGQ
jgi:uncharacterized protein (DUF58 family)